MIKRKTKKTNLQTVQTLFEKQPPIKSNTIIFGGIVLAISSIVLLIFVLSEKVFPLS